MSAIDLVVSRPDEVEQRERPHRVARAGLHRDVDLLDRADALLEGAHRVEHVGHEQPVDDEARLVLGVHERLLRALLAEAGSPAASDSSSVVTVWTTSSSGITCAGLKKCSPMKRSGRFVEAAWSITASDDVLVANTAPSFTMPSSSRHSSSFLLEVLGDRLDHEVAVLEAVEAGRALDPAAHLVGGGLLHLALLDRAAELLLDLADALAEAIVVHLAQHHVVAGLGRDLGDAMAHEASARHTHFRDLH